MTTFYDTLPPSPMCSPKLALMAMESMRPLGCIFLHGDMAPEDRDRSAFPDRGSGHDHLVDRLQGIMTIVNEDSMKSYNEVSNTTHDEKKLDEKANEPHNDEANSSS